MNLAGEVAVMRSESERSSIRRAVSLQAFARDQGAKIIHIHVCDLSPDGCGFMSDEAFETATIVWVKIKGLGARRARIAWNMDKKYGCEFDVPLHYEELETLHRAREIELRAATRASRDGFGRAA